MLARPVVLHLVKGQQISIGSGAVLVTDLPAAGPQGIVSFGNVVFRSSRLNHVLVADLGRLTVRIAPLGGHRAQLC